MELKKSLRRLSKFGSSKIKKNSLQLVEEKFEIKEKVNKKNISSPTLKSKSWKSGKSVKSGTSKNKKNLKIGLNCNKNNRFEIKKLLGEGSFSKMYLSYDKTIEKEVALKVEKQDKHKKILVHEYDILRNLQCLNTVPRVIDFINATSSNFIVMELLGMNISCFKKLFNPNEFICVDLLIKMFNCIEKLHETGYIHRDIKPSNFVLSKNCQDEIAVLNTLKMTDKNNSFSNTFSSSFMAQIEVYMIDFGLSKFHLDKNGNAFPAKKNCDFQGTLIYASINAHLKKELSRRDDLWSFFFVIIIRQFYF